MNYYCTLFDSLYLSRGLAMYDSLKACSKDFHLFIYAFDDITYQILKYLEPGHVTAISLKEFETEELLEVKKTRSKAEYCWTCTPSVIAHTFENFKVPDCTYIDSDLFFYSDPAILISELDKHGKNVLVTEHRYSLLPRLYEEKRAGRFCVQFMTFRNEENSLLILDKWRNQCLEWCYARHEDGKFGDQKYLDEWPDNYDNVHVLLHPGGGLAPWNISQYKFTSHDEGIKAIIRKNNETFYPVFFHFQYVKMISESTFDLGWYKISRRILRLFYLPYLNKIMQNEKMLMNLDRGYNINFTKFSRKSFKNLIKTVFKKIMQYNIIKIS